MVGLSSLAMLLFKLFVGSNVQPWPNMLRKTTKTSVGISNTRRPEDNDLALETSQNRKKISEQDENTFGLSPNQELKNVCASAELSPRQESMTLASHSTKLRFLRPRNQLILICAVLSAFLTARNTPPDFPRKPSAQFAVNACPHHDQRPRCDHDGCQWSRPADTYLPVPVTDSAELGSTSPLSLFRHTKGARYNRPPPLA